MLQHRPLPAEVFHELAGQFDCIPFNAADARNIALIDLRQHVVQTVSKLMEQGNHIVMRQQGWVAIDAVGKVTDQVGHGSLKLMVIRAQPSGANVVHPSTTPLACACWRVKVELTDQLALTLNAVKSNCRVPNRRLVRLDVDFKQGLNDFE